MLTPFRLQFSLVVASSLLWLTPLSSAQEQKKEDETKTDDRLVCIGALAGAHIYTTYGYVGGVADAFAHDVYNAKKVQDLMKEVIGLSDVSVKQLKTVRNGNIVDSDKKVIDDVIEVYGLLSGEARALSDYSRSKDKDDLQKYENARTTVWPKIKAILGIKDPEPKEEK